MNVNNVNKERIESFARDGKRFDGRKLDDLREVKVEEKAIKNADGSAIVEIGKTKVIAGVKIEIGTPYPDTPDEGTLMTTAELLPLSSPDFEPGPPKGQAIELARIVDRGIRESGAIDTKKLCLKKGEEVMSVFLDIYSLNDDGNLIDASALAAVNALKNAYIPKVKDGVIQYGDLSKKKLPVDMKKMPVTLTFVKIGNSVLLDPNFEEEKSCDARLSLAVNPSNGIVNAMQKGGKVAFTIEELNSIVDTSVKKVKELKKFV